MAAINGNPAPPPPPPLPQIQADRLPLFFEGISLILSRWTALQMAVVNEWGGRNSRAKSEQLASEIFTWFTQSKEDLYIDDLENKLGESLILLLNTEIEDGSDEEVAEQLMIMHEEFLEGDYSSVENLRNANLVAQAVTQSRQVVNEDDDESSDDELPDMLVDDEQKPKLSSKPTIVAKENNHSGTVEAEDGWVVVPSRRNRQTKH